MLNTFFGKKLGQTQVFTDSGQRIAVTQVMATPCTVVQAKIDSKDGYLALQLGIDQKINQNITKPLKGHIKKTGQGNYLPRFLREIRLDTSADTKSTAFKAGDQITVDQVFQAGDMVKVTGISKAKGFQGGVRRHGFKGGPRTHGQSDRERAPGSIGQTTTPGRVYKGKRMAGRMGGKQITIRGLKIVKMDSASQLLSLKGLVPGLINGLIKIEKQLS